MTTHSLLELRDVESGYGDLPVVRGVDLTVEAGQIVTVVGANGAGKTTLLRTITGLVKAQSGSIRFGGVEISKLPAHAIPGMGLVMVPEGRRLFPMMTIEENLLVGGSSKRAISEADRTLARVYELFPKLAERRKQLAGSLSGGEQQMCAIGRAVMAKPMLLILDEPSLGLAPIIVEQILELVKELAAAGMTILLIEQNVHDALELADHASVLEQGEVVMTGSGRELLDSPALQRAYLGI